MFLVLPFKDIFVMCVYFGQAVESVIVVITIMDVILLLTAMLMIQYLFREVLLRVFCNQPVLPGTFASNLDIRFRRLKDGNSFQKSSLTR